MTKSEYRDYIASEDWQQRRKQFLDQKTYDGRGQIRCERCKVPRWIAVIAYDQDLHVHHKNYLHLGCETAEDLEILCRRCHEIETFGRSELRELRSLDCTICRRRHYDPYGTLGMCPTCRDLSVQMSLMRICEGILEGEGVEPCQESAT